MQKTPDFERKLEAGKQAINASLDHWERGLTVCRFVEYGRQLDGRNSS